MMFFIALVSIVLPGQTPTFRGGVTLVKVDVSAANGNGRTISDLAQKDFEVFDEGAPQPIAYFDHESEPLDLLLLLDVSGSMHRSLMELAATARAALRPLGRQDRVGVMLFARESAVRQLFTEDFGLVESEIANAVKAQDLGSGTAINAAVRAGAEYIGRQPASARRAVLIVTDNLSLNYRVPDEVVIRALYAADATLDGILIGKQRRPEAPRAGTYVNPDFTPSDIFKLAAQTGGEAVEVHQAGESFPAMIERIRSRYRLQYQAPASAAGAFHRVEVRLTEEARRRYPRAVLRARAGYYAAE
ncbi:MAG TPA: VWA domain-containing protein [Bryobacteraceae bacterium]|nr:VWA domain-containing protein [Bryobacteraceae bacterium]